MQEPGQRQVTSPVHAEGLCYAVVQEPVEDVQRDLRLLGQTEAMGHDDAVDALLQDVQKRALLSRESSQGLRRVHDCKFPQAIGRGLEERQALQVGQVACNEAVGEAVEGAGEEELHDSVLGFFFCAGRFDLGSRDKRWFDSVLCSSTLRGILQSKNDNYLLTTAHLQKQCNPSWKS